NANPSSTLGSSPQEPPVTTRAKFTARINKLLQMRQTIDSLIFKTMNELTNQSSDSKIFCPKERMKELELRMLGLKDFLMILELLLLRIKDTFKWDQQVISELVALRNFAKKTWIKTQYIWCVGIKRLLDDLRVTATEVCVTTASTKIMKNMLSS
ncbi:hypothetical protein Tco_1460768, partial [Tanacetum coccineum]